MSLKYTDLSECTNSELVELMDSLNLGTLYAASDSDPDQIWWSDWSAVKAYEDITLYLVPMARSECAYGQSSVLELSNYQSLQRDFPDTFTQAGWANVSQTRHPCRPAYGGRR